MESKWKWWDIKKFMFSSFFLESKMTAKGWKWEMLATKEIKSGRPIDEPSWCFGSRVHQLVMLPMSRARSIRSSVKPTLGNQVTRASGSDQMVQYLYLGTRWPERRWTWNGASSRQSSPLESNGPTLNSEWATSRPNQPLAPSQSNHFKALTWVTSSRYWARRWLCSKWSI